MGVLFSSGMHPRVLVDGFEIAKRATLQFLENFKTPVVMGDEPDREILKMVARTALRTKVSSIHWFTLILGPDWISFKVDLILLYSCMKLWQIS
jgi:hypothetical protein